jgi:photoactive yellow protein
MSQGLINEVPLGLVELDEAGTVLYYRREGAAAPGSALEGLVGRNFFTDIAPIASAEGFRDRVNDFRRAHVASQGFDYRFDGDAGGRPVRVLLARVREGGDGKGRETLMVSISPNHALRGRGAG